MAKGDAQLMMNLCLVALGATLFLVGLGSHNWVKDEVKVEGNESVTYFGLWTYCYDDELNATKHSYCKDINTGTIKDYFMATRVLECLTLVVYAMALFSCFTADDRHPSESCTVCVRRYFHVAATFCAGGMTFLNVLIFGVCYKDDDWFTDPSLAYSFWLTFVGALSMTLGGVMRVVFIVWPDRPTLPTRKLSLEEKKIKAPKRRRLRRRRDDELGPDPLPPPIPSNQHTSSNKDKDNKPGKVVRFFKRISFKSNDKLIESTDEKTADNRGKEEKKPLHKPGKIRRFFGTFFTRKDNNVSRTKVSPVDADPNGFNKVRNQDGTESSFDAKKQQRPRQDYHLEITSLSINKYPQGKGREKASVSTRPIPLTVEGQNFTNSTGKATGDDVDALNVNHRPVSLKPALVANSNNTNKPNPTQNTRSRFADLHDSDSSTDAEIALRNQKLKGQGQGQGRSQGRSKKKKRVSICEEPFVSYNIPPSPPPPQELPLPHLQEHYGEGDASSSTSRSDTSSEVKVKPYELAMEDEERQALSVVTPPAVAFPPSGALEDLSYNKLMLVKKFVDKCRVNRKRQKPGMKDG